MADLSYGLINFHGVRGGGCVKSRRGRECAVPTLAGYLFGQTAVSLILDKTSTVFLISSNRNDSIVCDLLLTADACLLDVLDLTI